MSLNNFILQIATINGSGSQSANNILVRSLFRMGLPVAGKNLFPSNIQGLATWFNIRVSEAGYTSRQPLSHMVVAMNLATVNDDIKSVQPGGYFFYNKDFKLTPEQLRSDLNNIEIPFRQLVDKVTESVKIKKLLNNMIYVGILQELLNIDPETLSSVICDQFTGKGNLIEINQAAIQVGAQYAREALSPSTFKHKVRALGGANTENILIDGNSAAAIGLLYGGCSFVSWYPITPSSSLVETFVHYAEKYRRDNNGKNNFAVVQAEDELASFALVLGAGWAGARAITATSGPGLSLMAEGAGLSYYAEIPAVIWDVQRVGPSTGLPTRTQQCDLLSSVYLSHGDTKHVVLLPANPDECFEFAQTCFDLAESLNTLVIVLSDLNLGMNFSIAKKFKAPTGSFSRGKVLTVNDLNKIEKWGRYLEQDGDGITPRTLPGTEHPKAAYFTRGTGHNEFGAYSEGPEDYTKNVLRLARKYETARALVPKPLVDAQANSTVGLMAFGSTDEVMKEVRDTLSDRGIVTDYLRLRAIPFSKEVTDFVKTHKRIYVVEQNRDGQLLSLLRCEFPNESSRFLSITHFDGLPIYAQVVVDGVLRGEHI